MTFQSRITSKLNIPYALTYGRRKRLKITLDDNGRVLAYAPKRLTIREIESFIEQHEDWIRKAQVKMASSPSIPYCDETEQRRRAKEIKMWASAFLAGYDGKKPTRISVRNMSSRWGSCSTSGNISLSVYLLDVEEELREYVFIHELSHLYQMNHSPLLWNKVAEKCPNYKECRKRLRNYRLPKKPF